ncbi:Manganese/iron superoxide dismutase [Desulfovibrio sp. X2]|uniref:superoxide dismutase n=1 Tax=Desulfovibrio sp. X2 TaxID=941449 RepID=UPI000358CD35|nr:superoxide dismutase [Desulfovibrio sp. X2]EPR39801.1 Manganese/iron superoxide dismutase [Desulfovibrio sp. X2]
MSPTMNRRSFIKSSMAAAASVAVFATTGLLGPASRAFAATAEPFPAPPLPYPEKALEPVISARTVSFHYGKHTAGYYANLNKMVAGTPMASMKLEGVVQAVAGDPDKIGLYHNAAQALNHTFYWNCLAPGGKTPPSKVKDAVAAAFGSWDTFVDRFEEAAKTQFGSGWAWLAKSKDGLAVVKTANADTPVALGHTPILTLDVWEHAYYLDYQNRRPDYVKAAFDKLVNWDFVARNLA